MNRRALIVFVILNIAISVGVALLVIVLWQSMQDETETIPEVQVFEVVITATPGPTQTPWIVTVQGPAVAGPVFTPGPGEPTVAPTLNADVLPQVATNIALTQQAGGAAVSESGEITYTVQDGDNPSIIAEAFDVSLTDFLCINDLGTIDDPEFIFPGDVVKIPGPGFVCEPGAVVVDAGEEETPTETGDGGETGPAGATPDSSLADAAEAALGETPIPTVTLAPTAADAQVVVTQVVGAGDVTSEGVVIRNQGGLVDMEGWTLYDTQGNVFTFPDYRLFSNGAVTVYSRVGENTAAALFWDETRAVWQPGDVVSLADAIGEVQSTLRVGETGSP